MVSIVEHLEWLEKKVQNINPIEKIGNVVRASGTIIESMGPEVSVGSLVSIRSEKNGIDILAEVVGFKEHRNLLMPLENAYNIHNGCQVFALNDQRIPVGDSLRGRVIDGLGKPLDALGSLRGECVNDLYADAPNPMQRKLIQKSLETGIKAIDTCIPVGIGQRLGIFSGSGVGKSTLLGMMARGSSADVNVIALVGERGRELREFIENDLGEEGLKRSVLVVSTSDQSPAMRMRAAFLATRIAEDFRDRGNNVLFMMDSVTRLAMAQREIGLAVGEPPASRGYTPSVFALLPKILERSGMSTYGSITALYTVLVEGDDMNEPVADAVRGILDGHIVLSRHLATANHFPAIDVLESISRLTRVLISDQEYAVVAKMRDLMALYRKNEDLISIGAYTQGTNAHIDEAITKHEPINTFLQQKHTERVTREDAFNELQSILA